MSSAKAVLLSRLVLVATVGLPSCGRSKTLDGATSSESTAGDASVVASASAAAPAIAAAPGSAVLPPGDPPSTPAAVCPIDSVRERVCGSVSGGAAACTPTADGLMSFGESRFSVTVAMGRAEDPALARFRLDEVATGRYRQSLPASLRASEYCCYQACTPLAVAAAAPPDTRPGLVSAPRCIDVPERGTSRPARTAPTCPAAVTIEGGLRPFSSMTGGRCCYEVMVTPVNLVPEKHPRGRPLLVGGRGREATVASRRAWA